MGFVDIDCRLKYNYFISRSERRNMFNWLSFLSYAFITGITPGPNNIMCMTNGARYGFRKSLPFNFGVLTGFSAVMLLCVLFCSAVSAWIPRIKLPMLILGAAYMLHLAWGLWRDDGHIEEGEAKNGYLAGLLLQVVNAKMYLYYIVSLEAYILPFYQGQTGIVLLFGLGLVLFAAVSNLLWLVFGTAFRKFLSRYARWVNKVMALLLVYCAVSLFMS